MREYEKVGEAVMRFKFVTVGVLLAGLSMGSNALTLGRVRGAAWIGQPLQLVVPLQLDPGQDASAACVEADVFHAENKMESTRVSVTVESTPQAETFNVRISSSTLIDEPVVTVYLRAGCSQKIARRFVLLADYPTESQAPLPIAAVTPSAPLTLISSEATARPAESSSAKVATARTSTPKLPASGTETLKKPAPTPETPKTAKITGATAAKMVPPIRPVDGGRSKLKLDPLENLAERIKTLEATTSTVPLEEMVRDSQRIQQLQSDIKALLGQAAKNEANLLAMRERLEKAESERVSATWLWLLAGLILACVAGLLILWNRRTEPNGWQRSLKEEPPIASPAMPTVSVPVEKVIPSQPSFDVPSVRAQFNSTIQMDLDSREKLDVDVNLMDMNSDFGALLAPTQMLPPSDTTDFHAPKHSETKLAQRDFNGDELNDARQAAEFFEKLGKMDQAVETLEQKIRTDSKDAPLLYLDLLQIANTHNLKTDFRQFRDECEQMFNVKIPEFALFRDEGRTLESYPSLLQHICKLWPKYSVLDVIEACVLRDPWEKNATPFELAAFKDLILLHGIAKSHLRQLETHQNLDAPNSSNIDIPV